MSTSTTSQGEYILGDDEVIITHTDPTSRITYANPAFLASSEFSLEECIGQPQNIVRHPDMPRDVFADLWRTIKSGRSWTGIVKNRRKHGGFYWVRANVTPIIANGRVVGYTSVRVKPTRSEIQAAERLYADIRVGRQGARSVRAGHIHDASLAGHIGRLANLSLRTGTWLVLGTLVSILTLMTGMSVYRSGFDTLGALGCLGIIVAVCNLLYVQGKVVGPLVTLQRAVFHLLAGDTKTRIPIEGVSCVVSVARTVEQLRSKLDGVLKDNVAAAEQVRDSVDRVVSANTELSSRTQQHAASLEETAASLEQLTAAVSRNTESARHASQLASQSSSVTEHGSELVSTMLDTMGAISESSNRIGEIVGIIDGIAFQTNLLALNAAVEAARAGDQGRGFAVVAQEVRSLAQRSAASAKEIKDLIEQSRETVKQGGSLASQAAASMRQVTESAKKVANVILEIQAASQEQSAGIEQINRAVTQMDTITQDDAHLAQDLIATAEVLRDQAAQMLAAISAFSMQSVVSRGLQRSSPAESAQSQLARAA
ncbi:MAG TPA: methyl-accepting chemotaxis protein [Steroidobacteraceae bacterium]|nr:methyl-accepting chemotaxis protein [Steroidobacteraceae bacterium]